MPSARCADCGRITSWRPTRGARLSDLRCTCGGKLSAARNYRIRYMGRASAYRFQELHFTAADATAEAARMRKNGYEVLAVEEKVGPATWRGLEAVPA